MDNGNPFSIFQFLFSVSRWGSVLFWMAGIFYFSSRPRPLGFLPSFAQGESTNKIAHFAEYAGLVLLLYRALEEPFDTAQDRRGSGGAGEPREKGNKRKREFVNNNPSTPVVSGQSSVVALALALAYAISDELHQEFTPGRSFELADVVYDLAGMIAALGVIWIMEGGKGQGEKGTSE